MTASRSSVYQSIVDGTARATGAAEVALFRADEDSLSVVAVSANGDAHRTAGEVLPAEAANSLAFVLTSGQPLSLGPQPGDDPGPATPSTRPILCVPCVGTKGVVGAIEIHGPPMAEPFGPEASLLASLFADVAGALLEDDHGAASAPSPVQLSAELAQLADAEPARYAAMATTIEALLGHG